jgi:hypothetical protein
MRNVCSPASSKQAPVTLSSKEQPACQSLGKARPQLLCVCASVCGSLFARYVNRHGLDKKNGESVRFH